MWNNWIYWKPLHLCKGQWTWKKTEVQTWCLYQSLIKDWSTTSRTKLLLFRSQLWNWCIQPISSIMLVICIWSISIFIYINYHQWSPHPSWQRNHNHVSLSTLLQGVVVHFLNCSILRILGSLELFVLFSKWLSCSSLCFIFIFWAEKHESN